MTLDRQKKRCHWKKCTHLGIHTAGKLTPALEEQACIYGINIIHLYKFQEILFKEPGTDYFSGHEIQ